MRHLALLLPLFASSPARADTSKALEAKVALEASLERRVQSVLSEVLGTTDLVVIISAEIVPEKERVNVQLDEVLPGVPVKETQVPSALRTTLTMVRKVAATVVVDEATPEARVALARKVTTDLLGLDEARGDSLTVEKMVFHKPAPEPPKPLTLRDFLSPPNLWAPVWMVLALLALVIVLTQFLKPLVGVGRELTAAVKSQADAMREASAKEEGPGAGLAAVPGAPGAAASALGNGHKNGHRDDLPFGFVRDRHLGRLVYLLRKETPDNVAVVVHYLSPEHAAQVLSGLDLKVRSQVAARLGAVAEMDAQRVKLIEDRIKGKVDFIIGGEERLAEIMDRSDEATQEAIVSEVGTRNPELAERLRTMIVRFTDVEGLEPKEWQAVLKRVGFGPLASVLKAETALWEAAKAKLPEGVGQRLAQEIDLARALPPEALDAEKRRVVDVVKQLAKEGWIVLKKGEAAAEAEAEPETSPPAEG